MPKQKGFTLLEILVSIAIISLVSAVILPNLTSFNSGQQVKIVASELKNTLKNASSRSSSNIKCSGTKASSAWVVTINNNPVSFNLRPICDDQSTPAPFYQSALTQPPTIEASSCNTSFPAVLTFMPNSFTYTCNGISGSGDFSITLKETSTSQTATITVTRGGVISEQ